MINTKGGASATIKGGDSTDGTPLVVVPSGLNDQTEEYSYQPLCHALTDLLVVGTGEYYRIGVFIYTEECVICELRLADREWAKANRDKVVGSVGGDQFMEPYL